MSSLKYKHLRIQLQLCKIARMFCSASSHENAHLCAKWHVVTFEPSMVPIRCTVRPVLLRVPRIQQRHSDYVNSVV